MHLSIDLSIFLLIYLQNDIWTSKSAPDPQAFHFWLEHVLRATTACTFSSFFWPNGSAPAALASLRFDPSEPQIIAKNTVFRDLPSFLRTCIFSLLTFSGFLFFQLCLFSSLLTFFSDFHPSKLSEAWLLNFVRQLFLPGQADMLCFTIRHLLARCLSKTDLLAESLQKISTQALWKISLCKISVQQGLCKRSPRKIS